MMNMDSPTPSDESLLCQETMSGGFDEYDHDEDQIVTLSESDLEYIGRMVQEETANANALLPDSPIKSDDQRNWLKFARFDAINWIFNNRAFFGFHCRTAYLSLMYFDRFFSRRVIGEGKKLWATRLLSVACLSLAAKMEEVRVPALPQYHVDECVFEGILVQKMELLVLTTLDWNLKSLTAFDYLHYFIAKFCGDSTSKELVSRATEFVLAIVKEINLVERRPSIIAAAAVLAAHDCELTDNLVENKMSVIASWGSFDKEHVLFCYKLLQENEKIRNKTPISVNTPHSSAIRSASDDVRDNSLVTGVGTKRKLGFTESDQHSSGFPQHSTNSDQHSTDSDRHSPSKKT